MMCVVVGMLFVLGVIVMVVIDEIEYIGLIYMVEMFVCWCEWIGLDVLLLLLIGVDQFVCFDMWCDWCMLFDYVYIGVLMCLGFEFGVVLLDVVWEIVVWQVCVDVLKVMLVGCLLIDMIFLFDIVVIDICVYLCECIVCYV